MPDAPKSWTRPCPDILCPDLMRLLNASGLVVYNINRTGVLTTMSESCFQRFGYKPDEMVGKVFDQFLHPDDREACWSVFQMLLGQDTAPQTISFRVLAKNGNYLWCTSTVQQAFSASDHPEQSTHVGIIRSIQSAYSSSEVLESFYQSAVNKAAIVSATDDKGNITYANPNFCRISGYTEGELIGKNHRILKSGVHSKEYYSEIWKTITQGETWQGEICNRSKDGSLYWVYSSVIPFVGTQGKPAFYLSIRYDITELKQAQIQMQQQARLNALGQMGSGIAHEINNPLTVILSKTEKALRECQLNQPTSSEEVQVCLTKIHQMASRIQKIVKGMHDFSKNSAHNEFQVYSLNRLISDTLDLCREDLESQGIQLISPQGIEIQYHCHPTQVSQVLMNLIHNARDAILESSKAPADSFIEVQLEQSEDQIRIGVKNSGPPIPDAVREHLMEPFFTTKAPGKGTGLGLHLSRQIMKKHGGELRLCPKTEQTCFKMIFPKTNSK